MNDVTLSKLFNCAVEWKLSKPSKLAVDAYDSMAAMVSLPNGDVLRVEEDEGGMEGAETGCVGESWTLENS